MADRVAAKDVNVRVGLASMRGNLHTVVDTTEARKSQVHLTCPDCANPTVFVEQRYVCTEDATHGPYTPSALKKGTKVGDKIVVVDSEAIMEARTSILPPGEFDLQVHSREDVENNTFGMGNVYVFTPTDSSPLYGVLVTLLRQRPDVTLVAKTNMRKQDKLVQVDVGMNGQLLVRELIWPADFKEFAAPVFTAPDSKLLGQAEQLLDSLLDKFDPAEYTKDSRARIAAVVEEAAGTPTPKGKKAAAAKPPANDLAALLEASIAKAKPKGKKAS